MHIDHILGLEQWINDKKIKVEYLFIHFKTTNAIYLTKRHSIYTVKIFLRRVLRNNNLLLYVQHWKSLKIQIKEFFVPKCTRVTFICFDVILDISDDILHCLVTKRHSTCDADNDNNGYNYLYLYCRSVSLIFVDFSGIALHPAGIRIMF